MQICLILTLCAQENDPQIRKEILAHGKMIRMAFAVNDTLAIKELHHPDVIKALAFDDVKNGREEVMEGLKGVLENFQLEFVENEVENILINGNLALEQTRFKIKGTPRQEGESFVFSGRTMVTYVRYESSPSGWATIREIIQPATGN